MSEYVAEVSGVISAAPESVYAVLSDYVDEHPKILPPKYFKQIKVLAGGRGAGTILEAHMNVFGVARVFQLTVAEPEPGRVLTESDEAQAVTTVFVIDPIDNGSRSRLTIKVRGKTGSGIVGVMEKLFNPSIMRHIFRVELGLIEAYMLQRVEKESLAV